MADFTEFKLAQPVSRITTFITALFRRGQGVAFHADGPAQVRPKASEQALHGGDSFYLWFSGVASRPWRKRANGRSARSSRC